MSERDNAAANCPPSRESDLEQLAAVAAWYTPAFLMQATRRFESSHRLRDDDAKEAEIAKSTVAGRYLAVRGLLASPEQIDRAIQDLRDGISVCGGKRSEARQDALLQAWIEVEPALNEGELRELRDGFLGGLFPGEEPPALSRGRGPQVGGNSQCP